MLKVRRSRGGEAIPKDSDTPFEVPILQDTFDRDALFEVLGASPTAKDLRDSVETLVQAMRPAVAREVIEQALTKGEKPEQLNAFLDHLVPTEVIERSQQAVGKHGLKLEFSVKLLGETDQDRQQAIDRGLAQIREQVAAAYTLQAQNSAGPQITSEFEAWQAERAS